MDTSEWDRDPLFIYTPPDTITVAPEAWAFGLRTLDFFRKIDASKDWVIMFEWVRNMTLHSPDGAVESVWGPGIDVQCAPRNEVPPQAITHIDGVSVCFKIPRAYMEPAVNRRIEYHPTDTWKLRLT